MAYTKRGYSNYKNKKPTTPVVRKRLANPSEYQCDIFTAVKSGCTRLHINALAGCGKTSTSVEIPYHLPRSVMLDSCQVAFNSDICKELKERVPEGVDAKTFHGLCRTALVAAVPSLNDLSKVDKQKYKGYIRAELGDEVETQEARENLEKIIDRARGCMIYDAAGMVSLMDRFDIQTGHLLEADFLGLAEKILKKGLNDFDRIDFYDMISMPLYHNFTFRKYKALGIDEVQDMDRAQREAVRRSLYPDSYLWSVGDRNQRIYGWRGADLDSIDNLIKEFGLREFILPRTYRCGKAIVESARKYVPELECPADAHDGEVIENFAIEDLLQEITRGDALISRINAPLVKWCFAMIRAGIPANILGRDVGENLIGLVNRSKSSSVDELVSWIWNWKETEIERRIAQKRPTTWIEDASECILTLAEGLFSIRDVVANINRMFSDKSEQGIVTCSTTHKAKGKEWGNVFMLEGTFFLKNSKDQDEEKNLAYVAETRAKNTLIKVVGR